MPRGRKPNKSVEEQIKEIDLAIEELKDKRKKLVKDQEALAVAQLIEAAKAAGKTPAELVAELSK